MGIAGDKPRQHWWKKPGQYNHIKPIDRGTTLT
jgi:hypothetical protein